MQPAIEWLLRGDAAIRWQVQRDLLGAEPAVDEAERARVASYGWGRRLLSKQGTNGHWGGGIYSPKWISTTYTLLLLRDMGLAQDNPQVQRACATFFFSGLEHDGGVNWFKSRHDSEVCVNGMIVSLLSYFRSPDPRLHDVVAFFLRQQMPDGGWNCERISGATHSSLNTTILVLEGLSEYAAFTRDQPSSVCQAVEHGHEFLLRHRLYKSHRTGRVINSEMTRFHFPPRWHFDILRGLDYFQSVGAARDTRMKDAVNQVESRQTEDGRWLLNKSWTGRVFFEMEQGGAPSRWNTMRALRVLKWWNA